MKSKSDTRTPQPTKGSRPTPDPEGLPEELTDERTVEWDVEALDESIVELASDRQADASQRAVVASVIDDGSAGAYTPRERAARRSRRDTVPSVLPSMLAKSMRPAPAGAARPATAAKSARDPAAPAGQSAEVTRRVVAGGDAVLAASESGAYSIEMEVAEAGDPHTAPTTEQLIPTLGPAATLVLRACSSLDAGDVAEAVIAASAALTTVGQSAEKHLGDLTDTAGGPLARIFSDGPVNKVPVVSRADAELDGLELDELHWALLRRLDGRTTLCDVFRATKIPAVDALKIAASLLREGVIRIDERARE